MSLNEVQTETIAHEHIAASHQTPQVVGAGVPIVLLPEGYRVGDLEHHLAAPARKKGTTTLHDSASFIAVVNDQKGNETRLFSTIVPPTFTAVFNHIAEGSGWGDHRAQYNAPLSPEWETWNEADGKKMRQTDIARFIESNLVDVRFREPTPAGDGKPAHPGSPDGATLLEVCRTLEAKKKVDFKSSIRLSDGSTQFTYDEEVSGSARAGTLSVPEQFSIGVPVFENGALYLVDVRLRYRIEGGVVFWLELVRPHKTIEHAVKELRELIAKETGLPILTGTPSSK